MGEKEALTMSGMDENKEITELNESELDVRVDISEDKLQATLKIFPPKVKMEEREPFTYEDLTFALAQKGVVAGLNKEELERLVAGQIYYEEIVCATGKEAKDGIDGVFDYKFDVSPKGKPKILEDGSVDYRSMHTFEKVVAGQEIVVYTPAVKGEDGYLVTGLPLKAKIGKTLPIIRGKGFTLSDDNRVYTASLDGKVELRDGKLSVTNFVEVDGDIDVATGNLVFNGDICILGNVATGFIVNATGCITINGYAEGATIIAGKDVVIKGGMNGGGKGMIKAGGSVEGKFFELTQIRAVGYVKANNILNCDVETLDVIEVAGKLGSIVGGRTYALQGMTASSIGKESEIPTQVEVGPRKELLMECKRLREEIGKMDTELEALRKVEKALKQLEKAGNQILASDPRKIKLMRSKILKSMELEETKRKFHAMEEEIQRGEKAEIVVTKGVYPGVKVTIGQNHLAIKDAVADVTLRSRKGKNGINIGIFSNE